MVGGRTLLAEDPRLIVRDAMLGSARVREGRPAQPVKVGVATRIGRPGGTLPSLPWPSRFLSDGGGPVIVATTPQTESATLGWLERRGAEVIVHDAPRVDLVRLLGDLDERGIKRLMVEGGSMLVAALLEAGLVDELQLAIAPLLFGGETAPTPVGGPGWPLAEAVHLSLLGTTVDDDGAVILRYQVSRGSIP
jgi:riboflavin-specific deaminase-like protein